MDNPALQTGIWLVDAPATFETSRSLCLECAQQNGLVVRHEFVWRRERHGRSRVFADLVRKLDSREISVVVVATLSELAGSVSELRDIIDVLAAAECRVILAAERIDSDLPGISNMAATMEAVIRWRPFITGHVAATAAKVSPGKAASRPANPTPFGYRWRGGVLEADVHEAPVRAKVFELFRDLGEVAEVAVALNSSGARRRERNRFTAKDVERIIRDPVAKGVYRGNKKTPTPRMRTAGDEPGPLIKVARIISDDLWELCNRKLDARPQVLSGERKAQDS